LTLQTPDPIPSDAQVEQQPVAGARRGLLFSINVVFIAQIAIYGLAFCLRVVLARGLGDEGLGTYSLFFVAVLVAGAIANVGVGLGNIYFLNKGDYSYDELLSGSIFVLGASSLVAWAFLVAYGIILEPDLFVSGRSYWLYAVALPSVVGYVLLTSFLHGSSRFGALSGVAVAQGLIGVAVVGVLYVLDELDVFSALAGWVISLRSCWSASNESICDAHCIRAGQSCATRSGMAPRGRWQTWHSSSTTGWTSFWSPPSYLAPVSATMPSP